MDKRIFHIKQKLSRAMGNSWSVETMATETDMSTSYFSAAVHHLHMNHFIATVSILFVSALLFIPSSVQAQKTETRTVQRNATGGVIVGQYTLIPTASEGCKPADCEWFGRLRDVGNKVQSGGGDKSIKDFVRLFVEGLEKSYEVPLPNRPPQMLVAAFPARDNRKSVNGKVDLRVEMRHDGSIGEIQVVKGLRPDVDKRCIEARRSTIFLPAVKDRRFVSEWQSGSCSFGST